MNQVQNAGNDLYQEKGCDLFVAAPLANGGQFDMTEFLYNKTDGCYYLNGVAQKGLSGADVVYTFSSKAENGKSLSYYNMTALSVQVSVEI